MRNKGHTSTKQLRTVLTKSLGTFCDAIYSILVSGNNLVQWSKHLAEGLPCWYKVTWCIVNSLGHFAPNKVEVILPNCYAAKFGSLMFD